MNECNRSETVPFASCSKIHLGLVDFLRFPVTPVHSYPWRTFDGHLYVVGHRCSTNVQKLHEVPLDGLPDNVVASLLLEVFNYRLNGKDSAISRRCRNMMPIGYANIALLQSLIGVLFKLEGEVGLTGERRLHEKTLRLFPSGIYQFGKAGTSNLRSCWLVYTTPVLHNITRLSG